MKSKVSLDENLFRTIIIKKNNNKKTHNNHFGTYTKLTDR
jgi:hypothetical protein